MELKILGSVSPYPKDGENGVSYLVKKGDTKILLDLGYGSSRLLHFPDDMTNMHIIISHLHGDHYADLSGVSYASFVYNNHDMFDGKINLYIPKGYSDEDYITINKIIDDGLFEVVFYDETSIINIDGINITFQKTLHPIPTYAARLEDEDGKVISYTADSGFDESLISFYEGSDLLIADAGFLKDEKGENNNHSSAFEDGLVAKKAGVKKLVLSHLWPENDPQLYANEAKENFENAFAARTGDEFKI